jgi:hypothetical protein
MQTLTSRAEMNIWRPLIGCVKVSLAKLHHRAV